MYRWDFSFLSQHYQLVLFGLYGALKLTLVTLLCATVIGLVVGLCRTSSSYVLRSVGTAYVEFFRNIPALVQVFWFFYAIPILTGVQGSPFIAAATALSFYSGAYFAEIYRSGIQSVERGQWEAGRAIGFGYFTLMRNIVLPQAIKRMIPALTNQTIELAKLSTVASTIAYPELLYYAKLMSDIEFRPLESYTTVAVIFVGLLLMLSYGSSRLEEHARQPD